MARGRSRSNLFNRWGLAALVDSMAPQVRGRDRLLSAIRGNGVPAVLRRTVRIDWGPGLTTHLDPSLDGSFADLFKSQWVQPALVPILETCLDAGDLFVDVGANIGLYTSWAGRLVGPAGEVIAAEPIPDTCALLRGICDANDLTHVEIHQVAVGDRVGAANMEVVPGASGLSTMTTGSGGIHVDCTTLDELLDGRAPALVKVDVEGHELEVLRGGEDMLRRAQPVVTFESPNLITGTGTTDCVDHLAAFGYITYALTTHGLARYSGSQTSHNLLAIPSRDHRTLQQLERTRFPRNQNT